MCELGPDAEKTLLREFRVLAAVVGDTIHTLASLISAYEVESKRLRDLDMPDRWTMGCASGNALGLDTASMAIGHVCNRIQRMGHLR